MLPVMDARRPTKVFQAGAPAASVEAGQQGQQGRSAGTAAAETSRTLAAGTAADGLVDLNRASAEVLEALPGIGPSKARLIVATREQRGGFRSVEELDQIPGVGPALMAQIRGLVTVSAPPPSTFATGGQSASPAAAAAAGPGMVPLSGQVEAISSPRTAQPLPAAQVALPLASPVPLPGLSQPHAAPTAPGAGPPPAFRTVNINTASAEELASLSRIGPKLAERIVEHRQRYGPFRSPEALEAVKGIGPAILQENLNRITVR